MNEIELLRRMIGFNTESKESNIALSEFLTQELKKIGFRTEMTEYELEGVKKANVYGIKGPDNPGIVLSGHMDTVPATGGWTANPFSAETKAGRIYGLGAADMKGPIAAMITAAEQAGGLEKSVEIALTFNEETHFEGVKKILDSGVLKGDYVILGEPTQLQPVRASKGFASAVVELYGTAGHSSNPKSGISAIGASQVFMNYLEGLFNRIKCKENPDFQPPYATFNIGKIQSGTAVNLVPDYCKLEMEFRPLPGQPQDLITEGILKILDTLKDFKTCRDYKFEITDSAQGFELEADDKVLQKAIDITGKDASTVSYCTEASCYTPVGKKCIVLGPGSIEQAHKPDEYIEISQMQKGVEIYRRAIERLCGK